MTMEDPLIAEKSVFHGRLEDIPLPDIIQILQITTKSGALVLHRGDEQIGAVVFRNGNVVQAINTEVYQTLGDRLVETGAITRPELHDTLRYMARYPGMRVGDALTAQGLVSRERVEEEVKNQIAETVERLMGWTDTEFEFRLGLISLGRGVPNHDVNLILEKGVEPRQLLLEASLIQDRRASDGNGETRPPKQGDEEREAAKRRRPEPDEEDAGRILQWFDEGSGLHPTEPEEAGKARAAGTYLSLSEELFVAQGRGEIGLLLLRYASELYADGGLVMRDKIGFRVMGQFGQAFWLDGRGPSEPKTHFAYGESPLFDLIAADKNPYESFVSLTPEGGLAPADKQTKDAVAALAVPLLVLGKVSLILFCRNPVISPPDTRPLIALARQVSVTLENNTLRVIAKAAAARNAR